MNDLIGRYVYDVTRRLPEKDRDEVSKELKSNIFDMLPDGAGENEVKSVIYQLGPPVLLAEKYRPKPRYLIAPAFYDDYVRVLKRVLPLVGVVALAAGMILGAIGVIKDGMADWTVFTGNAVKTGISMGISAVFQALFWTTAGFVIAERKGAKAGREWKIEDLPQVPPNDKGRIPLSDSVTALILTIVFAVVVILMCAGILPVAFVIITGDTEIRSIFSPSFLAVCAPVVAVMALLGAGACVAKIVARRWTPLVCGAVIVSDLINMCLIIYLLNRPDLFSAEFSAFLRGVDWGSFDLIRIMGTSGINTILMFFSFVVVVASLAGCGQAVYKTFGCKARFAK